MVKTKTNRTAVYFFFDKDGVIRDYNLFFINSLKDVAQRILVVSNGQLTEESLKKLKRLNIDIYTRENKGFDVWAYKDAMDYIGWKDIVACDELILCNFTCYGPIYPFQEMFDTMAQRNCDFWGAAKHPEQQNYLLPNNQGWIYEHIMSYFMVIRHNMLVSPYFKEYWDNIPEIKTKTESTAYHETVFTKHFEKLGFKSDAFVDLEKYKGRANNGSIFYANEFLIKDRCPLVKRRAFFFPLYGNILNESDAHQARELMDFITHHTDYDENMIWDDMLATQPMSVLMNNLHLNKILSQDLSIKPKLYNVLYVFGIRCQYQLDILAEYQTQFWENTCVFVVYNTVLKEKIAQKYKNTIIYRGNDKQTVFDVLKENKFNYNNFEFLCSIDVKKKAVDLQITDEDYYRYLCDNLLNPSGILPLFEDKRLGCCISYPANFSCYYAYQVSQMSAKKGIFKKIYNEFKTEVPFDNDYLLLYDYAFWCRSQIVETVHKLLPINVSIDTFEQTLFFLPYAVQMQRFYMCYVSSVKSAEHLLSNDLYMHHKFEDSILNLRKAASSYFHSLLYWLNNDFILKSTQISPQTIQSYLHFRDVKRIIKEYIKQKWQRLKTKRKSKKTKNLRPAYCFFSELQKGRVTLFFTSNTDEIQQSYLQAGIYKFYPKYELSVPEQDLLTYLKPFNLIGAVFECPLEKVINHSIKLRGIGGKNYFIQWAQNIAYNALDFPQQNCFVRLYKGKIYIETKLKFYKSIFLSIKYSLRSKLLFLLLQLNPIHKYILFAENGGAADNSFELFKYAVKKNPNCYFIVNKKTYQEEPDKFIQSHMVKFNSAKHRRLFVFSKLWISSWTFRWEFVPQFKYLKDIHRYCILAKWNFIPHGITGDRNSIGVHKYVWNNPTATYVSSAVEQAHFSDRYGYRNVNVLGYPRMDKWVGAKLDANKILLFFTWRFSFQLMPKSHFLNTAYWKNIADIVDMLKVKFPKKHIYYVFHHEIVKGGYDNIIKEKLGTNNISYIYFNSHEGVDQFNQQFKTAKYLITDYSSVAYDFAYKKGSIPIYYLNEEFISGHYPLEQKFYDIHLGVLTQTLSELEKALKMNAPTAEMRKRKNKFFKYQDNKNCERVYAAIFNNEGKQ